MVRAARAGYAAEVYENCHLGAKEALGAFDAWNQSSGHHRAVVLESAQEIATARSGPAWVQHLGMGTNYRSSINLGAWAD